MVITALFGFESSLSDHYVREIFAPLFAKHPRFRSVLSFSRGTGKASFAALSPHAAAVPEGVIHTEAAADRNASPAERASRFHARVDEIASTAIPTDGPLWRLHHFPGFTVDEPGLCEASTILLRIHHVLGDGIGLVDYCFKHVAGDAIPANNQAKASLPTPKRKAPDMSVEPRSVRSVLKNTSLLLNDMFQVLIGVAIPDSKTVLSEGHLGHDKFLHFIPGTKIKLDSLKQTAKLHEGTVTGILVATLTGAVREYLLGQTGECSPPFPPSRLHTALAFDNHHGKKKGVSMSNEVLLLPISLHVGKEHREERLRRALADVQSLKDGFQPAVAAVAFKILAAIPAAIRLPLWRHFTKRTTIVLSSVPGPTEKVSIGGQTVDNVAVAAPADGHCGAVVTTFSYAGRCSIVFGGDRNRIAHPNQLESLFLDEYGELQHKSLT